MNKIVITNISEEKRMKSNKKKVEWVDYII